MRALQLRFSRQFVLVDQLLHACGRVVVAIFVVGLKIAQVLLSHSLVAFVALGQSYGVGIGIDDLIQRREKFLQFFVLGRTRGSSLIVRGPRLVFVVQDSGEQQ